MTVDEPALSCFGGGQRTVFSNGGLWEPAHFFFFFPFHVLSATTHWPFFSFSLFSLVACITLLVCCERVCMCVCLWKNLVGTSEVVVRVLLFI